MFQFTSSVLRLATLIELSGASLKRHSETKPTMNLTETSLVMDKNRIAQLLQDWCTWRDAGDWDALRTCYTTDATMVTSWYEGSAAGFIDASVQGRNKQPKDHGAHHIFGGTTAKVNGDRATAETRITLIVRGMLHGKLVDVTLYGRFFDCLLKSDGKWQINDRKGIYDRDSLRAVDPSDPINLDAQELAKYPYGYRHLAYLQAKEGAHINMSIPQPYSEAEQAIYAHGKAWVNGVDASEA